MNVSQRRKQKNSSLRDIRDEFNNDIRIVFEPKSRRLEADVVMESLFKLSDLEVRIPLNLNVLDPDGKPVVMDLRSVSMSGCPIARLF